MTSRRRFLVQGSAMAGSFWLPKLIGATERSAPAVKFPTAARERIAVATYPFRDFIRGWMGWDGKTPSAVPVDQQVEMKDFAAHVGQKFGIRRIELWSPVFPSTEARYVDGFQDALRKAGSSVADIAVDGEFSQYSSDKKEREKALTFSQRWIDVAAALGSPSIRTHLQGTRGSKPDAALAADNLRRTADYAAKKNVVVHLENDDPVSEDPFFIVQVIEKVNSPWLRALPDFGNTLAAHDEQYAYRAIDAMFAHAYGICHVKDRVTDAQGKAIDVDLARTFAVLKRRGFKGYCSMEYDAPGDPYPATAELIRKTAEYLA